MDLTPLQIVTVVKLNVAHLTDKRGVYNLYTLDVPKIRQISNQLIFEQVHFQSSNLVYATHTSGNLLVIQKRLTNNPKLIAIAQK